MTTDAQIRAQYLKLIGAGFLIIVLVFVSHHLLLLTCAGVNDSVLKCVKLSPLLFCYKMQNVWFW